MMRRLCVVWFLVIFLCQAFGTRKLVQRWNVNDTSDWQKFQAELQAERKGDTDLAAKCEQKENTYAEKYYCRCDSVSSRIMIDPAKTYEFSIDINPLVGVMKNYFGFFVYDNNGDKIEGSWNEPYFKNSYDNHLFTYFETWTAYILPHHIPDTDSDGQPDSQNHRTNGREWIWPTNASYAALRFGSCYNGTGRLVRERRHEIKAGKTWFRRPSVREIEQPLRILFSDPLYTNIRMFKITDSQDWSTMPEYSGMAFVNGKHASIAKVIKKKGKGCPRSSTRRFPIDPNNTYEFSVWLLSTSRYLHNFLGFRVYDAAFNILKLDVKGTDIPYFKRTENDTETWTRWNGFVVPATTDPNDIPKYYSNGVSWQWPLNSKYAQLRFGTCYGHGDNAGKTYFAYPQVVDFDLQP
ncbi:uncharacterized protein LOC134195722 [Corticium candelabrum]|uniref:uncharacterized protein LOC134195722 n=1 Tax=Corticium candelabrum TaxID=121492 RepID=UPI002E266FD1|nr:uncharacterized protein LOC134195722 [Corticium candelabrum]